MEFKLKEAAVCADREFEMIKITPEVRAFVEESGIENGLVYVITEHTTTGITVAYIMVSIPISAALSIIFTLEHLVHEILGLRRDSTDRSVGND